MSEQGQNIADVLARAKANGVEYFLNISSVGDVAEVVAVAEKYANVFASVGMHPEGVCENNSLQIETLLPYINSPKVIAIGECGLDCNDEAPIEFQKRDFIAQIHLAQQTDLPVIVHNRGCDEAIFEILRAEFKNKPFKILIHCFAATQEFAQKCLDLDAYISFSGILTFKNAKEVHEVAKLVPSDKMLVETDSPFLAPTPLRGKPCEPAYTRYTAEFLANLRGCDVVEIETQTTDNFFTLFDKANR